MIRFRYFFVLFVVLTLTSPVYATIITPPDVSPTATDPFVWGEANVRADASVAISPAQPRNGDASLEFQFTYNTNGQDKADYEVFWDPAVFPNRTLGNLQDIQYDWYVDSSTTGISAWLAPVLRLYYLTPTGDSGLLVYEQVYNGINPAPTDSWQGGSIVNANFWMRAFGAPSVTIDNYDVTLAEWIAGADNGVSPIPDLAGGSTAHVLGADTLIIGVNVGIGSGWGNSAGDQFLGYVDNVLLDFGADDTVEANFEVTPAYGSTPGVGNVINMTKVLGTSVNTDINVFEVGSAPLIVDDIILTGSPVISLTSPTAFTINDGDPDQTVAIACNASATGTFTTTMTIDHNSPSSPATYTVNCIVNPSVSPPAPPPSAPPPAPAPPASGQPNLSPILTPEEMGVVELPTTGETPLWAVIMRQVIDVFAPK